MKQKLSISIDKKLATELETMLKDNKYRNKSHIIEFALTKLIGEAQ